MLVACTVRQSVCLSVHLSVLHTPFSFSILEHLKSFTSFTSFVILQVFVIFASIASFQILFNESTRLMAMALFLSCGIKWFYMSVGSTGHPSNPPPLARPKPQPTRLSSKAIRLASLVMRKFLILQDFVPYRTRCRFTKIDKKETYLKVCLFVCV